MADLIFAAQFVAAQVGKTGLTVTVDVDRYTISDGSRTALVTAGAATEGRRGLYSYRLASANLALYQYIATFITTNTTVDQQEIPTLGLVVPDALVSAVTAVVDYASVRAAVGLAAANLDAQLDALPTAAEAATAAAAAILVTPANKLATSATGEAAANVTMQAGVAVAAADANGNVPANVMAYVSSALNGAFRIPVNVDQWMTNYLDIGYLPAVQTDNVTTINGYAMPSYGLTSVSGNVLTLSETITTDDPAALVGWLAYVEYEYWGGDFPLQGTWMSRVTAATTNTLTLANVGGALPSAVSGTVYLVPSGAVIDGQDVADALLLAPAGAAAAGSAMDYLADIVEDTGTTLPGLIAAGGAAGSGAITFAYTLTSSVGGAPIADADVWVTSDENGDDVLASGRTDQYGVVTFYLDAGTVYVWRQKSGWDFINPDTEVVS